MNIFEKIHARNGFTIHEHGGMIIGRREDGTELALFRWSNDRHAETELLPRRYLVVATDAGRYRLPMVTWTDQSTPISAQRPRPIGEVLDEFDEVFGRALDLSPQERFRTLSCAGDRYDMDAKLGRAITRAGLSFTGFHQHKTPVLTPSGRAFLIFGAGDHLMITTATHEPVGGLPLEGVSWQEIEAWIGTQTGGAS